MTYRVACRHVRSKVLQTRGDTRRRQCLECGHRWTTVERPAIELADLTADVLRRVKREEPRP